MLQLEVAAPAALLCCHNAPRQARMRLKWPKLPSFSVDSPYKIAIDVLKYIAGSLHHPCGIVQQHPVVPNEQPFLGYSEDGQKTLLVEDGSTLSSLANDSTFAVASAFCTPGNARAALSNAFRAATTYPAFFLSSAPVRCSMLRL